MASTPGPPRHLAHAERWGVTDGSLDSLDEVLVAVGYDRATTPESERRMRRLVEIARHDDLAARVVRNGSCRDCSPSSVAAGA